METVYSVLLSNVLISKQKKCYFEDKYTRDMAMFSITNKSMQGIFVKHWIMPLIVFQCLSKKYKDQKSLKLERLPQNRHIFVHNWSWDDCALWLTALNHMKNNKIVTLALLKIWKRFAPVPVAVDCVLLDFKLIDFVQMYRNLIGYNLAKAHENVAKSKKRLGCVENVFTFHLVLQSPKSEGSESKNKEQRRFVCFHDVQGAINFYMNWSKVQMQCIERGLCQEISCLYECGFTTMNLEEQDNICRKWIFDIDAPLQKLHDKKMISGSGGVQDGELDLLNGYVVSLGKHLCEFLLKNNLVRSLPYFSILTRHTNQKLSWHLTCNVMGKLRHWILVISHFEQELEHYQECDFYKIVFFVDKCTKNNKKGQYMQTLMSMKTSGLQEGMFPFVYHGLFRGTGTTETLFAEQRDRDMKMFWQYITCSLMVFDPWCQYMNTFLLEMVCPNRALCKRKERVESGEGSKDNDSQGTGHSMTSVLSKHKTENELSNFSSISCPDAREWVQGFVFSASQFRTSFLPSMRESRNICGVVKTLKSENKCSVLLHTYVSGCGICPRIFKVLGKDYQHGSNAHCVVICIKMLDGESLHRAFAFCMSAKCKQIVNARYGPGWIEYTKEDYLRLKSERARNRM